MFGYRMRVETDAFTLILRPYEPGEESSMLPGMQSRLVTCHLGSRGAQTIELETEWVKSIATEAENVAWAICLVEDSGTDRPIGTTHLRTKDHVKGTATSGIVLYDRSQWGRGIAKAAHLARTLYAFDTMDLMAIYSGADQSNPASLRALASVGYCYTGTEYHKNFVDGEVVHVNRVLVVNPAERSWKYFWGNTEVPQLFSEGRQATIDALERARAVVRFF